MKKILISFTVIICILFMTGCNLKSASLIEIKDKNKIVTFDKKNTEFDYKGTHDNYYNETINNNLNISMTFIFEQFDKDVYESLYKKRKGSDYTFNGYKAFTYDVISDYMGFIIVLDKKDDKYDVLLADVHYIKKDSRDIREVFNKKEIQNFLNTINYKK